MFHFRDPEFLWLGLLLGPLLWWWLAQRRGAVRHPAASRLAGLPAGRSHVAFWGGTVLRLLALACLVIALARPRWPDLQTRLTTEGIAIVMVVDVSGSMATPDFEWEGRPLSRLEAVKKVFRLFVKGEEESGTLGLEGRPTDQIGLVVFGTRPDTVCPLTLSHSALLRALDEQRPRSTPGESETNLSDALVVGLHRLQQAGPSRKVLILLSDGEHNVATPASGWRPRQAAQLAASQKVPIYVIDAAGKGLPVTEPGARERSLEVREAAERTLRSVAEISKGQYFRAANTAALLEVYRQIDRQERVPIESFQYRRYHEGYPWLGLASFVLFVGAMFLEMTVWRRVP